MNFTSVQFHANPQELVGIVSQIAAEFGVFYLCGNSKTKKLIEAQFITLDECEEYPNLVVIFEQDYSCKIKNFDDLQMLQNDGVYIEVGDLSDAGLKESIISFSKEKVKFERVDPKKIISKFKKFTKTGAIVFNIKTGAEGVSRTHRYTEGAKALYDAGVAIIPFGGGKTVFFKLP